MGHLKAATTETFFVHLDKYWLLKNISGYIIKDYKIQVVNTSATESCIY